MKDKGHIKKLLPGGNTSVGFYSYFKHIIDPKEARKIYYFKGGPGVGKSYMMKKIGYELVDKGYDVEFHHCSAEPNSIDVVVVPKLKTVLLDATSPHADDPRYPGAVGSTVNLGGFLNEEELRKNKYGIIGATEDNKNIYIRVYKYLKAAKLIHDDIEWINGYAMDFNKVNKETNKLIEEYLTNIKDKDRIGKDRHLFGSAYTLKGHIDFAETYINVVNKIIHIKGAAGTGKSTLLEKLSNIAVSKGYDVDVYHEPLVPEKIESIVLPELNLALTVNSKFSNNKTIDLDVYINKEKINKYKEELEYSKELFNKLLNDVFINLSKTNGVHDKLEKYYVPNIIHEKLNQVREKILDEILGIAKEYQN